jgi:hypothetical protein
MPKRISRLDTFLIIFKHPTYIASTIISAAIFYGILYLLIVMSNEGVFLLLIPPYLAYALVITSGILFSISLYSLARSVLTRAARLEGGSAGVLLPSLGGLVASCGCSFSVLASILVLLGINSFEAIGLVSIINSYQIWLFLIMIAANITIIYIYLGRIARFFRKSR